MEISKFTKNDKGFVCACCGEAVEPLGYSSRDHCPMCLSSLHVDVNPGDRANMCQGTLVPVSVRQDSKKGIIIEYVCSLCGERHNNKSAVDDNYSTILSVMNMTYDNRLKSIKARKK